MNHWLLSIACHLVGAAALVYLLLLFRPLRGLVVAGRILAGSALIFQGTALGMELVHQGGAVRGLSQGLCAAAFMLLAFFFYLDVRRRLSVIGAFALPLVLSLLVPGVILQNSGVLPASSGRPLLPLHIAIALLGVSALALAALVGLMYLLLDRQMKGKRFGLLFTRLPPLQFLDDLNGKLSLLGFAALSVTLVTGAFFAHAATGFFWTWQPKEVATLFAWGIFAAVLSARLFAGWRGWRVALMTLAGFGLTLVSFLSSYPGAR